MKTIYIANILVAGFIGISSLFFPGFAARTVFSGSYPNTQVIRLVGCLWLAIALLSVLGLFQPLTSSPVLLLQLLYKGSWLLFVALPALRKHEPYPGGMAVFFLVWTIILPFVIPWRYLLNGAD